MNNIKNLIQKFKAFQESGERLKRHAELLNICDILLNDFPDELRTEPFYNLTLDVINELLSLSVGIGSTRMYEGSGLEPKIIKREMALLKKIVPRDEKMQNVITRIFEG